MEDNQGAINGKSRIFIGTIKIETMDQMVYDNVLRCLSDMGIDTEIKDKSDSTNMRNKEKRKIKMFGRMN